jgi:hypothetical protein
MELSSPDLLRLCIDACIGADAVIIPEIDVGIGFWAKCKTMERQCHLGRTLLESPRFFKRNILERISGYDPNVSSGEDWDLTDRLVRRGALIARAPYSLKHHLGRFSLENQLMKKFTYGRTMLHYASHADGQMSRRLSIYASAYAENVKSLRYYIYPILLMRTIEAIGLFAGMALSKTTGEPR